MSIETTTTTSNEPVVPVPTGKPKPKPKSKKKAVNADRKVFQFCKQTESQDFNEGLDKILSQKGFFVYGGNIVTVDKGRVRQQTTQNFLSDISTADISLRFYSSPKAATPEMGYMPPQRMATYLNRQADRIALPD